MPIINLTEEELTKLWDAVNDGAEPPPELAGRLFPSFMEKLAAGGKFDFETLNRIRIPTLEYAGKRNEGVILAGDFARTGMWPSISYTNWACIGMRKSEGSLEWDIPQLPER